VAKNGDRKLVVENVKFRKTKTTSVGRRSATASRNGNDGGNISTSGHGAKTAESPVQRLSRMDAYKIRVNNNGVSTDTTFGLSCSNEDRGEGRGNGTRGRGGAPRSRSIDSCSAFGWRGQRQTANGFDDIGSTCRGKQNTLCGRMPASSADKLSTLRTSTELAMTSDVGCSAVDECDPSLHQPSLTQSELSSSSSSLSICINSDEDDDVDGPRTTAGRKNDVFVVGNLTQRIRKLTQQPQAASPQTRGGRRQQSKRSDGPTAAEQHKQHPLQTLNGAKAGHMTTTSCDIGEF
jgi:hypothetical protein